MRINDADILSFPAGVGRLRWWRFVMALGVCVIWCENRAEAWQLEKSYPGELSGIDQSEAAMIDDSQGFEANYSILKRLLYRARRATTDDLEESCRFTKDVSLREVTTSPRTYHGWVFHLSGNVRRLEWRSTGDQVSDGIEQYGLTTVELSSGEQLQVAVLEAPRIWTGRDDLNEPVEFIGFFAFCGGASLTEKTDATRIPVFVAPRMKWHPIRAEPLGIPAGQMQLVRHGFDLGLLETCRRENLKPMSAAEAPAFYGMLAAVNRIAQSKAPATDPAPETGAESGTKTESKSNADFFDVMSDPQGHFGDRMKLQGHIRRVVPVSVESRFQAGIGAEFFQVDMFVPLGDRSVIVTDRDGKKLTFRDRFPVTVHIGRLNRPLADYLNRTVQVRGFFYRIWNYPSQFSEEQGASQGQYGPVIMAAELELLPQSAMASPGWIATIGMGLALGVIAAIVAFLWFNRRRDKNPLRRLPVQIEIDSTQINPNINSH